MKRLLFTLVVLPLFCGQASAQSTLLDSIDLDNVLEDYLKFRDEVNSEYAKFMEEVWKSYPIKEAEKVPEEKQLEPIVYDKEKDEQYLQEQKRLEEEKKLAEEKKQREEEQKRLAEEKQKQEEQQKQLAEEKQKQEEQQKQLAEEKQKQEQQQKQLAEEKQKQEQQQKQLAEEKQKQEQQQKQLAEEKQKQEQQQKQLAEEQKKQEEQQKLMAEEKKKQQLEQQRLAEERKKLEQEQQQLAQQKKEQEELQKVLEQQQKQDELKKLLAEKKKKEEEERLLAEKQKLQQEQEKLLAEQQKKQEEQQRLLAEQQKKQQEQQRLLAEQQKKQEEQQRLLAEQQKKQQEQEKLLAEQQKKQQEQEKLLADKKKQQEDQQRQLAEQQKQQQEQEKLLADKKKQQEDQQRQLAEQQKKQQEQEKLLADKKKQQEEQERLLAEQKKKLDEERSKPIEAVVVAPPKDKKQPKPIGGDIPKQEKPQQDLASTNSFEYYGTPMGVRWGKAAQFKLKGNDEKAFAAAYRELTSAAYNDLLSDCIRLRKEQNLCDWAYYKMLQDLAEAACGKGTNEAVFLQGVLFSQSGYQMRFAYDENHKLHLLTRVDGFPYNYNYTQVDGRIFFLLDGSKEKNLYICDAKFDKEQELDLDHAKLPKLKKDMSADRKIASNFVKLEAQTSVNKNMINFFNDYPISSPTNGKDVTMKWYKYGNLPLTDEVKEKLYPQLREKIDRLPKVSAANILLNWTQYGLQYMLDEKVWGYDRPFFSEETLYYPYADCEDRAILYSHLVRDLLDLDVVLVYNANPGHLYTAVAFQENVPGDYIMVNGVKYTVADPTYYGAEVGKTMSRMNNSTAKVLKLKKI